LGHCQIRREQTISLSGNILEIKIQVGRRGPVTPLGTLTHMTQRRVTPKLSKDETVELAKLVLQSGLNFVFFVTS
jgi:hypothetical protein